jgi:hypothetical protein
MDSSSKKTVSGTFFLEGGSFLMRLLVFLGSAEGGFAS